MRTASAMTFAATSGTATLDTPGPVLRRSRALAVVLDLLALVVMLALATAVALAWLLVRTSWGRDDALDGDTAVVFALIGAVPPVWLARLALGLWSDGSTPGQRSAHLRVEVVRGETRRGRFVRLMAHPLGTVGWAWLAAIAWLANVTAIAWPLTAALALSVLLGFASTVLWLVQPSARGLHDRLAGTRLLSARRGRGSDEITLTPALPLKGEGAG